MHVAFADILTWLCSRDIKSLNHLSIFLITQITSVVIAPFRVSLLYQPVNILPLLTA